MDSITSIEATEQARAPFDRLTFATTLILDALPLAGICLAVQAFFALPFWLDETFTAGAASSASLAELFTRWLGPDVHPPLHYLIDYVLVHLFGPSEWLLRLPSLAFYVATLAVLRFSARSVIGLPGARISAAVFAILPSVLYHAAEARGYALLMLLAACTTISWLAALSSMDWPRVQRFGLCCALVSLTHYFGALFAGVLFLILMLRGGMSRLRITIAGGLFYAALFGPWLLWHGSHLLGVAHGSFWIPPTPLGAAIAVAVFNSWGGPVSLAMLGVAPLLIGARYLTPPQLRQVIDLFAGIGLSLAIALLFSLAEPVIVDRYFNTFLPAAVLAGAILLGSLPASLRVAIILPACVFLLLTGRATYPNPSAISWRPQAERIVDAGMQRMLFIYDGPFIPSFDERNLASMAATFFRDRGQRVSIVAMRTSVDGTLTLPSTLQPPYALLRVVNRVPGYRPQNEWMQIFLEQHGGLCVTPQDSSPQLCFILQR